jgi:hypothetical protein
VAAKDEDEGEEAEGREEEEGEEEEGEEYQVWNFDQDEVGTTPKGILNAGTGPKGEKGQWVVQKDETAPSPPNALVQTAKNAGSTFNVAIFENTDHADLELKVKMKALGGQEDQGGGPIWRAKDANNYYITRFNPLENNFRVYKVVDGERKTLQSANVTLPASWHEIEIKMVDDEIECELDGKEYLKVQDTTFSRGKIGLWTKADAVTAFDDLKVEVEEEEEEEHEER